MQSLKIMEICGPNLKNSWPWVKKSKFYKSSEFYNKIEFNKKLMLNKLLKDKVKCDLGMDLIQKMLHLNPKRRIRADTACYHKFICTKPTSFLCPGDFQFLKNLTSPCNDSSMRFRKTKIEGCKNGVQRKYMENTLKINLPISNTQNNELQLPRKITKNEQFNKKDMTSSHNKIKEQKKTIDITDTERVLTILKGRGVAYK